MHTRARMLWVALASGEGLEESLALWMYCIFLLCLCRMHTMVPLDHSMSPEHETSGNRTRAIYNEFVILF